MWTATEWLNTASTVSTPPHTKITPCTLLELTLYRKDLRLLGRPLERTIIIDNLAENFLHTTPDNGIWVESWYDDMDDNILEILTPFLRSIVTSGLVPDVRKLLNKDLKEKVLYKCLEESKEIPRIEELL